MALSLTHIEHPATGSETAPPLLIAHGLFGSARNFNTLGRRLATNRRVVMVDMRNHGESPWDDDVTYPAMATDLAAAVDQHCGGRAVVLGHSMGGKSAMALALTAPERLAGLIVADIAPVPYKHSHLGFVQAMLALDLTTVSRRSDADRQLADAIPEKMLRTFLLQNLVIAHDNARWRLNLAALEEGMSDLLDWPAELDMRHYDGRALFIRGGASQYVDSDSRARIGALFPNHAVETLEGAGHWLHAEQPDVFFDTVDQWLSEL